LGGIVIATILGLGLLLQGAPDFVPGAAIGHVSTVDGIPAVAVRVVAVPVPKGNGRPGDALNYFELSAPTDRTLTDNEGNFRLQEIVPGRYYILAGANPNGSWYPGTERLEEAEIIEIKASIETTLNFKLLHRLGGKVSGKINGIAGLGPRTATITGPPLEDLLEVPVKADGSFEFGHLPPGNRYLVSLYPPTPGIASFPVTVGQTDVSGVELTPLPTKRVAGRIVVRNGSIPHGILGFFTPKTWVSGKINDNGTFAVDLHSTEHQIDFAGLPVGYSVASVKVGSEDVTNRGITVGATDVADVLITLNAPKKLAVVKGKITGLPVTRYASTAVVLTGPTFNTGLADVQPDGTYQFDAVVPGLYRLTLNGVPDFKPMTVVVEGFGTYEVNVTAGVN
jgi:hypothetical protein